MMPVNSFIVTATGLAADQHFTDGGVYWMEQNFIQSQNSQCDTPISRKCAKKSVKE